MGKKREVTVVRKTSETVIRLTLNIDGAGKFKVSTGIGFLDHMLVLFAKHGCFDLSLSVKGDLDVDIHHTNEDIAICLGQAFERALGNKEKIRRFSDRMCVIDEALSRVVLDINNRSFLRISPRMIKKYSLGEYTYSYFKQFLQSFVANAKVTLHMDVLEGEDLHHLLEASFKALALAFDDATIIDPRKKGIPST